MGRWVGDGTDLGRVFKKFADRGVEALQKVLPVSNGLDIRGAQISNQNAIVNDAQGAQFLMEMSQEL